MKYKFESSDTQLLNRLRKSISVKKKCGYSRLVSPGFVTEDISDVIQDISGEVVIITEAFKQRMEISDLNLRETEELAKFVQVRIAKDKLVEVTK
jgi:hypothetical protein